MPGSEKQNEHVDTSEKTGFDEENMQQRLDQLKSKLDRVDGLEAGQKKITAQKSQTRQSVDRALRLGTEFIAGIAVGGFIGYWIDSAFDTKPLWFVIFFFLGCGAGFLNVFRTARRIQEEQNRQVAAGELDLGQDLPDNKNE